MTREIIVSVLLLSGSFFMLVSGIGLLRYKDTLSRAHALTQATTLAIVLLLIALWVALGDEISGLKITLVAAFCLLTIPLASHLVASLYYRQFHRREIKKVIRQRVGSK